MPNSANASAEYRKVQPLGKIPGFEGANGFNLSEVIAIAIYGTLLTRVLFGFSFFFLFAIGLPSSPPSASIMMRFFHYY